MKITELFLDQLKSEESGTRRVLERVPEGRNDWKPHEKSMALGYLAALVAGMPGWVTLMVDKDELNVGDPSNEQFRARPMETRTELLKILEDSIEGARSVLTNTTDDHLMKPWR